jgi:hypothetical protein
VAKGKRQKRQSMRDLPANPDVLRLLELVDPELEAKPELPARTDADEDDRQDDDED